MITVCTCIHVHTGRTGDSPTGRQPNLGAVCWRAPAEQSRKEGQPGSGGNGCFFKVSLSPSLLSPPPLPRYLSLSLSLSFLPSHFVPQSLGETRLISTETSVMQFAEIQTILPTLSSIDCFRMWAGSTALKRWLPSTSPPTVWQECVSVSSNWLSTWSWWPKLSVRHTSGRYDYYECNAGHLCRWLCHLLDWHMFALACGRMVSLRWVKLRWLASAIHRP